MKALKIRNVKNAEQARDLAIDWQTWQQDVSLSYGELAYWADYFTELATKYPELREEFEENGII